MLAFLTENKDGEYQGVYLQKMLGQALEVQLRADISLCAVKNTGKNTYKIYDKTLEDWGVGYF